MKEVHWQGIIRTDHRGTWGILPDDDADALVAELNMNYHTIYHWAVRVFEANP